MQRIFTLWLAAALLVTPWQVRGQEAGLTELYGNGVHAYFAGQSYDAHRYFTTAINAGSKDPRAYYFRGLNYLRLGRPSEAQADFAEGARLEAGDASGLFAVDRALQRIQGQTRLAIERQRMAARAGVLQELVNERYEGSRRAREAQDEVIVPAQPPRLPETVDPLAAPPDAAAPPLPIKPAPAQPAAEDDAFGAPNNAPPPAANLPANPPAANPPQEEPPANEPAAEPAPPAAPAEPAKPKADPFAEGDPFAEKPAAPPATTPPAATPPAATPPATPAEESPQEPAPPQAPPAPAKPMPEPAPANDDLFTGPAINPANGKPAEAQPAETAQPSSSTSALGNVIKKTLSGLIPSVPADLPFTNPVTGGDENAVPAGENGQPVPPAGEPAAPPAATTPSEPVPAENPPATKTEEEDPFAAPPAAAEKPAETPAEPPAAAAPPPTEAAPAEEAPANETAPAEEAATSEEDPFAN